MLILKSSFNTEDIMSEDFIPTRGSSKKVETLKNFKSITYESYKPKKSKIRKVEEAISEKKETLDEFNIKRAKHEVVRFGTSGFDPQKKEEAKVQLAIKLGAKPPKNKYKNYNVLKEERAKQKQREKEKSQFQQLGKNSVGKSTGKKKGFDRKRRKTKSGILEVYGKVKVVNKE